MAGVFGVLSGLALVGITTSADANIGNGYTLLSIAGVILGGGEFVGGRVSPIGAVIGALTLQLAAVALNRLPAFLTFMHIPPDWQVGAQGVILIIVLAARALISRERPMSDAAAPAFSKRLGARPWIWSFVGAAVVWVAAIVVTHGDGRRGHALGRALLARSSP